MGPWRSQTFKASALGQGRDSSTVKNAILTAEYLLARTPNARPIFSLRHLSHLTSVDYFRLRRLVSRGDPQPYRIFRLQKRQLPGEEPRFRIISVPSPWLLSLQRWINENILKHVKPHFASVAFSSGDSIREAAAVHCSCKWLVKIDIRNFFENISERQVFRVFEWIGYQPLVSFELSRICTRLGDRSSRHSFGRFASDTAKWTAIPYYRSNIMGHLPQGAPTSPRLANLVARHLDETMTRLSAMYGINYTRYADDLTFSTLDAGTPRSRIREFIGEVYREIALCGFTPNLAKTHVSPPGARKIVLGLLVDREEPKLSREFKSTLRQHLHYLRKVGIGPLEHAKRQGNATQVGLRRHVLGLIQHARQIEPTYGEKRLAEFNEITW